MIHSVNMENVVSKKCVYIRVLSLTGCIRTSSSCQTYAKQNNQNIDNLETKMQKTAGSLW